MATVPASPTRKPARTSRYILIALVLVAGFGGFFIYKQRQAVPPVMVTFEPAVVRTLTQTVTATGKIQPEIEVKIAPEVGGEIIGLPFKEGDAVRQGDLLVRIKPDNYRFQVEQQEASLAATRASAVQSRAQLLKTQEDFRRNADLHAKNLISDSELTSARTSLDIAEANLVSAEAQIRRAEGSLSQAKDQLEKTAIYSPMDGTVSSRSTEVGERVAGTGQYGGAEIMRIADLGNMEVRVNVNENDIVNVKVGDRARVSIDAHPGRHFAGEVREIASSARTVGQNTQQEVTHFQVKIAITDKDGTLRPGMSASADIETQTVTDVVAVPIQSVTVRARETAMTIDQLSDMRDRKARETQGEGAVAAVNHQQQRDRERADRDSLQRVVYVRNGDTVRQVPVETGIADSTHMEIMAGVKAGDEVVSGSFTAITRTLKDGMPVRVQPAMPSGKK